MKPFSYDTETTGLYPFSGAEMFSFSVSDFDGNATVHRLDGGKLRSIQSNKMLKKIWGNEKLHKVMHNAKFDLEMTEKTLGKRLDGNSVHCTHKMSHILRNNGSHKLDDLTWEYGAYPKVDDKIKKMATFCGGYKNVPEKHMNQYQKDDAIRTMLLFRLMWPMIKKNPKFLECYKTEMELIWVTMRMEERGLMVHETRTKELIHKLKEEVDETKENLFHLTNRRFSVNSDVEVRKLLFKDLRMPIIKLTDKEKEPSTDKFVLMELNERFPENEVLNLILKTRSYEKGITTLNEYLNLSDSDFILHPSINTCGAITGRESCEHPNLQNVAKSKVLLNPFPIPARKAFRARPGYINLHLDYSGIEMRLIIHYAGEKEMIYCLNHGDGDVHSLAAESFYGKRFINETNKVTKKELRNAAKNANFAAPYAASIKKLMIILGVKGVKGRKGVLNYIARFPKVAKFSRKVIEEVKEFGGVETILGRFLYTNVRKPYIGANFKIQGTAAIILKIAQNRVHKYNVEQASNEPKLLLPIHDELVIEYPRNRIKDLDDYIRDIHALMIDFPMFNVPLDVSVEISTNSWEDKKEYKGWEKGRKKLKK